MSPPKFLSNRPAKLAPNFFFNKFITLKFQKITYSGLDTPCLQYQTRKANASPLQGTRPYPDGVLLHPLVAKITWTNKGRRKCSESIYQKYLWYPEPCQRGKAAEAQTVISSARKR